MAKETFRLEGLSDLIEALDELSKATTTNVLKRALIKAATPIADDASSVAPELTGRLRDSITVGTKLSKSQKTKKESQVEVYVGPAPSTKSITQEFGAAHHRAQPFMRPAWDANKLSAFKSLKDDIQEEIMKAAERAARKAARLLAKMKAS